MYVCIIVLWRICHIAFANLSFINLVSIFRCSSSKTNPVYGRSVNSFVLVLVFHHTDTSLYLLSLALALSIHNKQNSLSHDVLYICIYIYMYPTVCIGRQLSVYFKTVSKYVKFARIRTFLPQQMQ
jgi:hypothetical protein